MIVDAGPRWRCPHCRQPLEERPDGAVCTTGHRFDRAAEGYLHLLVGGRLPGRPAGDDADMIRARRSLFDHGHYGAVHRAVAELVDSTSPSVVLEAGCGEGTYLAATVAPHRMGLDVSKPGVRLAARRHRTIRFAVASSYAIPLEDACLDTVLSVFAPRAFDEFHRVLRPAGSVVVASPGVDHLSGLTALVYGSVRPHDERPHTADDEGPWAPTERIRVRFDLELDRAQDVADLLHMTPYWWRVGPERRAAIAEIDHLETIIDIVVTRHDRPTSA